MDDQPLTPDSQLFDLNQLPTVTHRFDHIIGNQLMCSAHTDCTSITVSPTAVLEPNEKGELVLVEKAVR